MPRHKLLSSKQQSVIDKAVEELNRIEEKCAGHDPLVLPTSRQTVWELIARQFAAVESSFDEAFAEVSRHDTLNRRFGDLSKEQYFIVCLSGCKGLDAPKCIGDGILRRFTMDMPVELALRLSFNARYEWACGQFSGGPPGEIFRPILHAAASRDFETVRHLASIHRPVLKQPADLLYSDVYAGVVALALKDATLLEGAVDLAKKSNSAYIKAITAVVKAVAENSTADFSVAMNKMLSGYKRYMFGDDLYGLVDPHAHGLYELCKRFSPDVVTEFDVNRKLPWDRDYFEWLQNVDKIADHLEAERISEHVRSLLFDFQPLSWGLKVRERWNS